MNVNCVSKLFKWASLGYIIELILKRKQIQKSRTLSQGHRRECLRENRACAWEPEDLDFSSSTIAYFYIVIISKLRSTNMQTILQWMPQ